MKKIKKTMSVVLALSLMSSTAVTVSHAEETSTDEVIMKPVDMTAMYNRNSIYHGALSKVLYNEDGSYALDANGKIKQTGVSGAAGYAGAIYYNSFIEGMEGSYTWNTPWSELPEGTTVNRLTNEIVNLNYHKVANITAHVTGAGTLEEYGDLSVMFTFEDKAYYEINWENTLPVSPLETTTEV